LHPIPDVLILNMLQAFILVIGIVLFAVAAYGDIRTLRIPNKLVIAVAVLGFLRLIVIGDLSIAIHTVVATATVFIVAFLLFWRNVVGGGDAKLITAAALLVGYKSLFNFLFVIGACGGLVSLVVLVTQWRSRSALPRVRLAVPYGVAIAAGGIVALLFQPSLMG
jgi:prepilin peptidase CpaA